MAQTGVRAVIEVKITPEREGGFDRIAERIAKYSEVRSCYLMSGAYNLLVIVDGDSLRDVAMFVAQRLATIHGVLSTATHFMSGLTRSSVASLRKTDEAAGSPYRSQSQPDRAQLHA